jgi:DNA-binding XRE family transcriptional regulator
MLMKCDGTRSFPHSLIYRSLTARALCLALLTAFPAAAQTPTPQQPKSGMEQAAKDMSGHARLKNATHQKQLDTVAFVTGNMLFVLLHETAHALVSEMGLPVLGREEDAADAYATVSMLKMGNSFSNRVLVEAAKGWFLSAERNERRGNMLAFYDEHGLDWQRAYQIVCLMVGSDPEQFGQLADWVQMPEDRQASCQGDYSNASWSWETVLKSHRRAEDQPKTKIDVVYGEGKGRLAMFAHAFQELGFLEAIAEYDADNYLWRRPFTVEMQSCGQPDAHWDLQTPKLYICYEMADEFLDLYHDVTAERTKPGRMAPNNVLARNIRMLRLQHGMSMEKLASAAGLDRAWMGRMEAGQETATKSQLDKLARALNMQSADLVALALAADMPGPAPAPATQRFKKK